MATGSAQTHPAGKLSAKGNEVHTQINNLSLRRCRVFFCMKKSVSAFAVVIRKTIVRIAHITDGVRNFWLNWAGRRMIAECTEVRAMSSRGGSRRV